MDESKAFEIAGRMGLEGYYTASGDEGTVVFLDDGRMLKLTGGVIEGSLCQALHDLQLAGKTHPAVPRVDGVFVFDQEVDLRPLADATVVTGCFAILRESFDDPMEPTTTKEDYALLSWAWLNESAGYLESIRAGMFGPDMSSVLSGLEWIRDNTGFHLRDVRLSNIGESASGVAGMRDFGRAEVDPALLLQVGDSLFPRAFEDEPLHSMPCPFGR